VNLPAESGLPETPLALLPLKDEAMAVSGIWGRAFRQGDRLYGHVLDPRSGEPVRRAWLSALAGVSATEADALTTAMLVLGEESLPLLQRLHPRARGLLVTPTEEAPGYRCRALGMDLAGTG
jgi:thiamine biosynthesis lipoprotein